MIFKNVTDRRVQRVLGLGLASPGGLGLESSPEMIKSQVLLSKIIS